MVDVFRHLRAGTPISMIPDSRISALITGAERITPSKIIAKAYLKPSASG